MRPIKEGLDYFSLDCALDDKFQLIEAEFGLTGFGVVVKLLQKIYGQNGYYIEWTDEVALLFSKSIGLGGSVVSEIIEASLKRGIFDRKIFDEYHILTSAGIQKRYLDAVKRRKVLQLKKRYLLVEVVLFLENADMNVVYVDINPENVVDNAQRKGKKSKETYSANELFEHLWKLYPRKRGKAYVKPAAREKLLDIGKEQMELAISRYLLELECDKWRSPQNGSTFFNGGYVDYLDGNYTPAPAASKSETKNPFEGVNKLD